MIRLIVLAPLIVAAVGSRLAGGLLSRALRWLP